MLTTAGPAYGTFGGQPAVAPNLWRESGRDGASAFFRGTGTIICPELEIGWLKLQPCPAKIFRGPLPKSASLKLQAHLLESRPLSALHFDIPATIAEEPQDHKGAISNNICIAERV